MTTPVTLKISVSDNRSGHSQPLKWFRGVTKTGRWFYGWNNSSDFVLMLIVSLHAKSRPVTSPAVAMCRLALRRAVWGMALRHGAPLPLNVLRRLGFEPGSIRLSSHDTTETHTACSSSCYLCPGYYWDLFLSESVAVLGRCLRLAC